MLQRLPALLLASLCLFVGTIASAAELEWDHTEVRTELSPNDEEARATYTVTNKSEQPVRIDHIKTSCGCTGSIIDRKIIEPGASTRITGTFHKGKRQGTNHNKLEVFLENQPEPVATLHMIVNIPTLVEATPRIVYWKPGSQQTERNVRITLDKRYVDTISNIEYNRERITLVEEADPSGKADRVLRVLPKNFDAPLRDTIVVHAQNKDGERGQARIHVFVQP